MQLYGARCHRRQLVLSSALMLLFFASNLVLPRIELVATPDGIESVERSDTRWTQLQSPLDVCIGVTKGLSWLLAAYHLLYVELCLEWRSDKRRYWRSWWNMIDVLSFVLVLASIPLEIAAGYDVARECLLSVLSVLLCVTVMQVLLVSSFFSVLIFTFARMCRVVAQFLFLYALLLLGFTGGFHLLFHGVGPHRDFVGTMRVVFLTTFGDLSYDDNFNFKRNARHVVGFALLALYMLVVTVVALNLLVALMTSEYERVRAQAEARSLLELADALHRYEKWIGPRKVRQLLASDRGRDLVRRASIQPRLPTAQSSSAASWRSDSSLWRRKDAWGAADGKGGASWRLQDVHQHMLHQAHAA